MFRSCWYKIQTEQMRTYFYWDTEGDTVSKLFAIEMTRYRKSDYSDEESRARYHKDQCLVLLRTGQCLGCVYEFCKDLNDMRMVHVI